MTTVTGSASPDAGPFRVVGKRLPMLEGPAKVSGAGRYVDDITLPGMLYGAILRSPHAHAVIEDIDTSDAERLPGVKAVVTARDQGTRPYIHLGGAASDRYPMARDKVRFIGEEVAAVAAETPDDARRALEAIKVRYRALPAVFDPLEALDPDAPLIHPAPTFEVERTGKDEAVVHTAREDERNVSARNQKVWGDVEAAFREADRVFEHDFFHAAENQVTMEPDGSLIRYDEDTCRYDVWTSTQSPYFIEKELANALDVDVDKIHIHEVLVGGGFGGKSKVCEHEVITALLARKAGRPVKLVLSRDEQFATTKGRHPFHVRLRTGVTEEGIVVARDVRVVVDNGAYNAVGPAVMGLASLIFASLYRPKAVRFDGRVVYTNKPPGGQFRGYGNPQATFALESQLDIIAEELGIHPVEIRRRNLNREGDTTLAGWQINSCGFEECLDTVADILGINGGGSVKPSPNRGIGIAGVIHCSGANIYQDGDFSEADVEIDSEGTVTYRMGAADPGTWQNTALAQIVAESLGVTIDAVRVVTMDSDETPTDLGTWGSRITFVAGNAAHRATTTLRDRLREVAADEWEASPGDVEIVDGVLRVRGDPSHAMSLGDAVARCPGTEDGLLKAHIRYATPTEQVNRETGIANISSAYTFAVQGAEVEVDPSTGHVSVSRFAAAHDVGRSVNPIAVEGQIEGASVMGLGAALTEELIFEQGKLVNGSYLYYGIPRASDYPAIDDVAVEAPDPEGPFGAKGVGEPGLVPSAAATANAVANATGARIHRIPLTPDRVLSALEASDGRPDGTAAGLHRRWIHAMRRAYPRFVLPLLHRYGTRFARRRRYVAPSDLRVTPARDLEDALSLGSARDTSYVGGGTDVVPRRHQGLLQVARLVDVSELSELKGVERTSSGLRIGAATTLSELAEHELVLRHAPLLATVARQIAGTQIRNVATVAGNLCQEKRCWFYRQGFNCYKRGGVTCPCYAVVGDNRFYHAIFDAHRCQAVAPSDLATAFAALDAAVRTSRHADGEGRRLDMAELYDGPGETVLRGGELIVDVDVPERWLDATFGYEKLRLREGDFPIVAAATTRSRSGDCRVVLGGVSYQPRRDHESEVLAERGEPDDVVAAKAVADAFPLPGNRHKVAMARAVTASALRAMRAPVS